MQSFQGGGTQSIRPVPQILPKFEVKSKVKVTGNESVKNRFSRILVKIQKWTDWLTS